MARRLGVSWPLLGVAVAAAGFSLAIETVQYLLPYRYSCLTDIGTNTLGAIIGGRSEARLHRS